MDFYLAPMEEVTGYVFRQVHSQIFGKLDKYITPFLVPTQKKTFKTKEKREIDVANNQGLPVVPQLLTNKSQDFLHAGSFLKGMGYGEVNLNLGCPSGTVVPKGRGSGFLGKPEELNTFFSEVFHGLGELPERERFEVSVKTRIGLHSPEEFEGLLSIYNRYPIKELTVHPRIREEFYKGRPHLDAFELAVHKCRLPLVYNGDIFTVSDYETLMARFPSLSAVMIGRGLVARPGLVREIKTGRKETKEELAAFTRSLYEGYLDCYQSEVGAMSKMKEVWYYLEWRFPDQKREIKKVKKATREAAYLEAVDGVFRAIC